MARSKLFCSFFLAMSSWVFVGFAQQTPGTPPGTQLPCVSQLLPCQPYMKQPSNPPASCCIVLKQVIADEKQCLCQLFNDPVLLKNLNITQNDALQLAKSCNANADPTACKTVGGPPTASPTPSTSNSSSASNSTVSSPPKSAAVVGVGVGAPFGVSAVIAFLLFLLL